MEDMTGTGCQAETGEGGCQREATHGLRIVRVDREATVLFCQPHHDFKFEVLTEAGIEVHSFDLATKQIVKEQSS